MKKSDVIPRKNQLPANRKRSINEALRDAISLGSLDCFKHLLSSGADIETMTYHDDEFLAWCSPLMNACYVSGNLGAESRKRENAEEMAKILVDHGADVNSR